MVNRTPERAQVMLADLTLSAGIRGVMVQSLADAVLDGVSLVVNCTTVGMYPAVDASPWSAEVPFPEGVAVYDMVYRPAQTRLMQLAEANGGKAVGGLGMLVRQGAAAFEIWTGQEAPLDVMFAAVNDALSQRG